MTNANSPAFTGPTDRGYTDGLSKREYIAALALQGLLSNPNICVSDNWSDGLPAFARGMADALLINLEKNPAP